MSVLEGDTQQYEVYLYVPFLRTDIDYNDFIRKVIAGVQQYNINVTVYYKDTISNCPPEKEVILVAHGNAEVDKLFSKQENGMKISKDSVIRRLSTYGIQIYRYLSCGTSVADGGVLFLLDITEGIAIEEIKKYVGLPSYTPDTDGHWDVKDELERPNHKS